MNYTNNDSILKRFFCTFFILSFLTISIFAQLPNGFTDVKVQSGYTSPMGVVFSKNGQRMFVWEKAGILWTSNWNGTTYVKQATPTLNLREEVGDWRDFGLESVALDPNFDTNGLIYLFYQVDRHHLLYFGTPQYDPAADEYFNATISRVTRYQLTIANGITTANLASRKILLGETKSTGVPATNESHAGGQIVFGTDGTLLVSTGDNASFESADMGSASETFFQQAIDDGIMRPTENVGAFRAQLINSFCGKLLRLDPVTGDAIPSNPYYEAGNPRSAKSRVWALGFRNPYRMTFKTGTGSTNRADGNPGTLIVGDVQNGTWEEIHIVEKGGVNCGWPLYEGVGPQYIFFDSGKINPEEAGNQTFVSLCVFGGRANINNPIPSQRRFSHSAPAIDYSHAATITRYPDYTRGNIEDPITIGTAGALVTGTSFNGTCITAGTYYTGTAFPPNYRNVFFFADYSTNWIKAMSLHDNSDHQVHEVLDFAPAGYGKGIVDMEMCPADESIFYVNINTGDIQKISFGATNRPPVAVIRADRTSGVSPLTVNLSSAGSFDPDGSPLTYDWDFGDGSANSTLPNPIHTFTSTGPKGFIVTLTVRDNQGLADSKPLTISTNNAPPSVRITNPLNNSTYPLTGATPFSLQSIVTDNDATGMQYAWQVTLRHNTHEHREPITTQQSPTILISPVGCDGNTYHYLIELTVTDNGGLTAKDSVKIFPDCNSQNLSVANLNAVAQTRAVAVTWTNPAIPFDEVMVVAQANAGFLTSPSGTNYTADVNFTGNGTTFEGGKVVYRSTGSNVTVTNLVAGTRYYFRVYTRRGIAWTGGVETSAVPTDATTTLGCLTASYFNNTTLTGTPAVIRGETSINNDYVYEGPSVAGIGFDNFSVRWDGVVVPPTSGAYTFTVTSDDGVRLWVNNVLILDKWFDQSQTTYEVTVSLTQGQNVPIKMEYYEGDGRAFAKLFWTIPNQASQVVAFKACTGTTTNLQLGCLTASYFNNTNLSGTPAVIRGEESINNDYVYGGPSVVGIGVDNFSVRWDGVVVPPTSGIYTFTVTSDDGVRLWINNVLVIDKWFDQGATTYTATANLTQGQNVPIKMEYYEGDGRAFAKLLWTIPNLSSQVVAFKACAGTITTTQLGCLKASYFANTTLSGAPVAVLPESSINNEYVYGGPSVTGIGVDNFSVRWEGTVIPPTTGTYTFTVTSDDGVRLWVNNVLVIDKWFDQGATTYTANLVLTKDLNIPIKMEYYEGDGRAFAKLFWTIPNQVSQAVAFSPCSLTALFDPNKCYTLLGRQSSKVMEIPNSALTNGAFVEQRTFVAGSKNQMWKIKANGDGTYRLMNANSGRVITIENGATTPSVYAIQMDWTAGNHQSFNFSKNNEGYYKMQAQHSGLPLEVRFSSVVDGARIWQSTLSGSAAQTFKIDEVGCPAGVVPSSSANIFVAYGYRNIKTAVINWVSNANDNTDYFIVQKLNPQQGVFDKLATFNAQSGTSTDKNFYTIEDTQPIDGNNIYRIALYRHGALLPQYSEIIVLDFSFLGDIMLFPNPSNDYVDIDLETVRYRAVSLILMDVSGKIVQEQKIPSAPIAPVRLRLDALPVGTYFMRIEVEGKREVVKKIVIAR